MHSMCLPNIVLETSWLTDLAIVNLEFVNPVIIGQTDIIA